MLSHVTQTESVGHEESRSRNLSTKSHEWWQSHGRSRDSIRAPGLPTRKAADLPCTPKKTRCFDQDHVSYAVALKLALTVEHESPMKSSTLTSKTQDECSGPRDRGGHHLMSGLLRCPLSLRHLFQVWDLFMEASWQVSPKGGRLLNRFLCAPEPWSLAGLVRATTESVVLRT